MWPTIVEIKKLLQVGVVGCEGALFIIGISTCTFLLMEIKLSCQFMKEILFFQIENLTAVVSVCNTVT